MAGTLQSQKAKAASVAADISPKGLSEADFAALIGSGARLRVYSFNQYKSKKPETAGLAELTIYSSDAAAAGRHYRPLEAVAEGVHLARDLVNEPPNILYPVEFANRTRALTKLGVKLKTLHPRR